VAISIASFLSVAVEDDRRRYQLAQAIGPSGRLASKSGLALVDCLHHQIR